MQTTTPYNEPADEWSPLRTVRTRLPKSRRRSEQVHIREPVSNLRDEWHKVYEAEYKYAAVLNLLDRQLQQVYRRCSFHISRKGPATSSTRSKSQQLTGRNSRRRIENKGLVESKWSGNFNFALFVLMRRVYLKRGDFSQYGSRVLVQI